MLEQSLNRCKHPPDRAVQCFAVGGAQRPQTKDVARAADLTSTVPRAEELLSRINGFANATGIARTRSFETL